MESLLPPQPLHRSAAPQHRVATPGPLSSFVRFVVCGGGVGVLSSLAVPLLALTMPWALANAAITVASTLLCTELHALFTFGTGRRPGLRRHLQSAGSATAAYVVTCTAMFLLHTVQSSPSLLWEQTVYLTASALAGTGRFLVLRLFVFATNHNHAPAAPKPAALKPTAPRPTTLRPTKPTDDWNLPFARTEAFAG
jgi:putative flippase GtrA